jgi:hypothetical protein
MIKVSYALDFEGPAEKPQRFAIFATVEDPRIGPRFTIPDAIGWAAPAGKDGARGARRLLKCLKATL